jgi:hypothetical protein
MKHCERLSCGHYCSVSTSIWGHDGITWGGDTLAMPAIHSQERPVLRLQYKIKPNQSSGISTSVGALERYQASDVSPDESLG